jgi:DNA-cytosine methyltransferase
MDSRPAEAFWVLEDTSSYYERGSGISREGAPIETRLYRVVSEFPALVAKAKRLPRLEGRVREFRGTIALDLLQRAKVRSGVVVAGSRLGAESFLSDMTQLGVDFVVALPPSVLERKDTKLGNDAERSLGYRLATGAWAPADIRAPESTATYSLVDLGKVSIGEKRGLRCIAIATGGIHGARRGMLIGVSSLPPAISNEQVAHYLGWTRWLRMASRKSQKSQSSKTINAGIPVKHEANSAARLIADLTPRVNLRIARDQDQRASTTLPSLWDKVDPREGRLGSKSRKLSVIELFAGAGGMGLGFNMATGSGRGYRVLFSGEIDPVYATTLRLTRDFLSQKRIVPDEDLQEDIAAIDLRSPFAMERVQATAQPHGRVDVIIGGPPCQGFSNANRNSRSNDNPNNKLVDTYLDYVVRLRPHLFIMENVQGILWTQKNSDASEASVAAHVATRLAAAGYKLFPKLIDSAWYGVPQHRNRFFLVGLHVDLGYSQEEFGPWGPYPRPTHGPSANRQLVTVRDALKDLPAIDNGATDAELPYTAPPTPNEFLAQMRRWSPQHVIWDHVTSRHANYVIDRYRRIPQGGNWASISDMMTNYADIGRTHSNIYRRLSWDEPAITIGHYRKAMLIHPSQDRGLSLREAARLQSFPDWFRFAGSASSVDGGLTFKQQQLGNAVSPLVTKAIAEYLMEL